MDEQDTPGQMTSAAMEAAADEVKLPGHVSMREHLGALEIGLRRNALRKPVAIIGAALTAFIGGFAMALLRLPIDGAAAPWFAAFVGVPLILYSYLAAAAFFNKTTVTVTPGHLRFVVGPVPFLSPKDIAVEDVAQLTSKLGPGGWSIFLRNRAGIEELVMGGLRDEKQAKQVERMIEERLRIVDDSASSSAMPAGAEPVPWKEATAQSNVEQEVVSQSRR